MVFAAAPSRKATAANLAFEGFIPCVHLHMRVQFVLFTEALAAYLTLELSFLILMTMKHVKSCSVLPCVRLTATFVTTNVSLGRGVERRRRHQREKEGNAREFTVINSFIVMGYDDELTCFILNLLPNVMA